MLTQGDFAGNYVAFAQICTAYYFAHFLIILPWLGKYEKPAKVPPSIADAVLEENKKLEGAAAQPAE